MLFLVLLFCLPSTPCTTPFENFDRGFNDISDVPFDNATMASADQCCALCDSTVGCSAWTFVYPPGPRDGCHLKFPTPPPNNVQPPCAPYCVSGHKDYPGGVYEEGYDRPGGDFASFPFIDGPGACAQACAFTPSCQSWTYVLPNGPVASACYLKNTVPGKTQLGCGSYCVSGVAGPYTPPPSCGETHAVGMDRYGGDYQSFLTDGPNACCAACSKDSQCVAWTYVEAAPFEGCHLKNTLGPLSPCPRCTSSGSPLRCQQCTNNTIISSTTCGAWVIWRPIPGHSEIHQGFGYDQTFQLKNTSTPDLTLNSGYYPCGYNQGSLDQCIDCGISERKGLDGTVYCLGVTCPDSPATYNVVLSGEGLSVIAPDESKYSCWFLDPAKGEALNCQVLLKAEMTVKQQWNYCINPNAPQYALLSHNCRYYVVAVMQEYCNLLGYQAPVCKCM